MGAVAETKTTKDDVVEQQKEDRERGRVMMASGTSESTPAEGKCNNNEEQQNQKQQSDAAGRNENSSSEDFSSAEMIPHPGAEAVGHSGDEEAEDYDYYSFDNLLDDDTTTQEDTTTVLDPPPPEDTNTYSSPSLAANNGNVPVAETVDEQDLENQVLEKILQKTAKATSVRKIQMEESSSRMPCKRKLLIVLLLMVIVGAAVGGGMAAVATSRRNDNSDDMMTTDEESQSTPPPTTKEYKEAFETIMSTYAVLYSEEEDLQVESSGQYQAVQHMAAELATNVTEGFSPRRYALAVLFYATNGPDWFNSNALGIFDTQDWCEWEGDANLYFECDEEGLLRSINLSANNLKGTIPPEISLLDPHMLLSIDMGHNSISGTLPSTIGKFVSLESLELGDNLIEGDIPLALGSLTNLTHLALDDNSFEEHIPSTLNALTQLQTIGVSGSDEKLRCSQIVPSLMGYSSDDDSFSCAAMVLSCSCCTTCAINPAMTNQEILTSLIDFYKFYSDPVSLSDTTSAQYRALEWVSQGTIETRTSWPQLEMVQRYAVATIYYSTNGDAWTYMRFFGPRSVCSLDDIPGLDAPLICDDDWNIVDIKFHHQDLLGSLPSEISLFSSLRYLGLSYNTLTGHLPTELGLLTHLTDLDLNSNRISMSRNFRISAQNPDDRPVFKHHF